MSWVDRIKLLIELASVVAVDKQTQSAVQRIGAPRKASRRSCQPGQIVTQFSIVAFHRVGIDFAFRHFVSAAVIPQAIIGIKGVTEILFGLGCSIHHRLNGGLRALPDHFPAQITARLPIYEREDVDPVFLWPI